MGMGQLEYASLQKTKKQEYYHDYNKAYYEMNRNIILERKKIQYEKQKIKLQNQI